MIPLGPLGLGEILGGAFATIGRHWKQLLGFAFAVYGMAVVLFGAALALAYVAVKTELHRLLERPDESAPGSDEVMPLVLTFGAVYLFGLFALLVANAAVYAGCPAVLQDAVLGRPSSFGAIWRRVWPRLWAVLGTVLITALIAAVPLVLMTLAFVGMVVALIALAADGSGGWGWLGLIGILGALATGPVAVWLWVRFIFAPAVAVLEGQGTISAMARSAQLVRGAWWRVFGISLLAAVMAAAVSYLIQLVFQLLSLVPTGPASLSDEAADGGAAVTIVVTTMAFGLLTILVGQILTSAFPQLVISLLYVDQRIRKENLAPALAEAAGLPPQRAPDAYGL
ncbi:glycerophosphoryl diester phosphodiesterase membrane domain-containing protein [Streptomyces sp. NPDC018833]|uniref:glycerophosphoryl diester phosphodiesterase membrane domain-containing protein n=1 Tax=Streptomyces sp. NPDC018833 TaxID=3365053 RepID=UPI0037BDAA30